MHTTGTSCFRTGVPFRNQAAWLLILDFKWPFHFSLSVLYMLACYTIQKGISLYSQLFFTQVQTDFFRKLSCKFPLFCCLHCSNQGCLRCLQDQLCCSAVIQRGASGAAGTPVTLARQQGNSWLDRERPRWSQAALTRGFAGQRMFHCCETLLVAVAGNLGRLFGKFVLQRLPAVF